MRSMTGYGSGTVQQDGWEVTVDLKTVNHRFLDLSLRLPRNLSFLEQNMIRILPYCTVKPQLRSPAKPAFPTTLQSAG